ncbi:ATPase, AFG1 family protein, putative [Babesia bigemina]|uniref:ATPase, AFG1 family protein, putative n=1 Tax=Babesia bigemina TaxID=5866 RepID=A0A061DEF5_BABBI|nr:ATPase, AFG1 family protein, putative [Babesia bigemina]CDR97190.1 ATPase, AFG1 family protein, putative [Babesia bigemina]|eukprot:XP_012769376.1 ATPase, AFG1 family protein, putative [Babesia bigemina]
MKQKKSPMVDSDSKSEDEYEVEDILDFRMFKKQPKYLVKWKGFTDADNTWEPESNLSNLPAFEAKMKALKAERLTPLQKTHPSSSSTSSRVENRQKMPHTPSTTQQSQQQYKKQKVSPEPAATTGQSSDKVDPAQVSRGTKSVKPAGDQAAATTEKAQMPTDEKAKEPVKSVTQVAAETEEAVEVEDLLDYKPRFKKDYFLVRWKGDWEDSWEPRHNLLIVGDLMNKMIDLKMSYLRIYGPSDMEEQAFVTVQSIRISGSATLSAVVVEMTRDTESRTLLPLQEVRRRWPQQLLDFLLSRLRLRASGEPHILTLLNISAMSLAYSIRSLVVEVSGPRKHELRDCLEKVRQGVALATQQGRNISSVEFAHVPRKRWRVTYLKSRFKHRKAIRHYVFERYTHRVSFTAPFDLGPALNCVLSSLVGGLRARCSFAWQFGSIPSVDACRREDAIRELCVQLERVRVAVESRIEPAPTVRSWFSRLKPEAPQPAVRGMYIYGGVGQGKTMLMDAFYDQVSLPKMRMHFHDFMIRVQREMHLHKSDSGGTVMGTVARSVLGDARLLCMDEFFVNHISDAMVLKPLFENIFQMGVVVICTSNRPPEDLYQGGLNRERFLPFIPLLKSHCDVFNLQAHDFRQEHNFSDSSSNVQRVYYFDPKDDENALMTAFRGDNNATSIIENDVVKVSELRSITVPLSKGGEAFFRFPNLCGSSNTSAGSNDKVEVSLGTDGFIALAERFHTIWISQVPQFDASNHMDGRLRSFMLLIDVLYERQTKLLLASKVPLLQLFGRTGIVKVAEDFQSRLYRRYASVEEFCNEFPASLSKDEFMKLGDSLGMSSGHTGLFFNAVHAPDEESVGARRIWDICENHRLLLHGKPPATPHLYRFDIRDENVMENEFVCSRALSRLFHMCSGNYLQQHHERFGDK